MINKLKNSKDKELLVFTLLAKYRLFLWTFFLTNFLWTLEHGNLNNSLEIKEPLRIY